MEGMVGSTAAGRDDDVDELLPGFDKVARAELSARLLESVEELTRKRLRAPRAG
jgi:hypothetical protein